MQPMMQNYQARVLTEICSGNNVQQQPNDHQVHLNQSSSSKIVPSELLENKDTGYTEEYDDMLVDGPKHPNGNNGYGCSVPMPIIQPQAQPVPPQHLRSQFHPPQYAMQYHQPMLQSSFTEHQRAPQQQPFSQPIGIKNLQLPNGAVPYYPPAHRIANYNQ